MADPVVMTRKLAAIREGDVALLDCIGWEDPLGDMGLRVFFASGFGPELIAQNDAVRLTEGRMINGALMAIGSAPLAPEVALPLTTGQLQVPVSPPETELFAGMRCAIAQFQDEPRAVVVDWLNHHVQKFGLEGLVLIDRRRTGQSKPPKWMEKVARKAGISRIVLLGSDLPLGDRELPASSHPFNAPDAPGKDRIGELAGDPWSAPLAELSLFELIKWRFLARASAVMNIELCDYLDPASNPFEMAERAGVVQLTGTRIFPWRVRDRDDARFVDHICRPFDESNHNRRWCVAPARLSPDQTWRFVRITEAEPQADAHFWRAMAISHPQCSTAEIVPKTALIEDEALVAMSLAAGHKPVRAPVNKLKQEPGRAVDAGRTCIVTCMKNEGPFILEWLAYHRAIGVEDVIVYTNDCTDGTDTFLDLLQEKGLVQRRDNPFEGTGLKPQHAALQAAEKEPIVKNAGWLISMDVDEFINIHVGDGRIDDLYRAVGEANMISLTWRLFGNADVDGYEDRFLIDQFTRCAPELCRKPHQAWGFKTLFRNLGIYKKLGVHRPKGLKPDLWDQVRWVNGSGKPMPDKLIRNGWRSTAESYGYELVTLNHYAVRSAESFLVKRDRGRVNHVARDQGLNYWFRMNNNWEEDRSILTKRDLLEAEYERLLSDPDIRAAHERCVAAHRAKIAELKARPDYAEFHADLVSPRMRRLARLHTHFGANVFLTGPQVIPDEVAFMANPPEDFFFTVEREKT